MGRKVLFVIADYPDERQWAFDAYISPRNARWAQRHGFDYVVSKGDAFRGNKQWCKPHSLRRMLLRNEVRDGDLFAWMDADVVIVDGDRTFDTAKSMTYALDNCASHSTGFCVFRINDWTRGVIDRWLDEDLYARRCGDPMWRMWGDQAAWYTIGGIAERPPEGHANWTTVPDLGWHTRVDEDALVGLDELRANVEVLPAEWNVSLLAEELDDPGSQSLIPYWRIQTRREDTVLRHFCGGQVWRLDPYCVRPLFKEEREGGAWAGW